MLLLHDKHKKINSQNLLTNNLQQIISISRSLNFENKYETIQKFKKSRKKRKKYASITFFVKILK